MGNTKALGTGAQLRLTSSHLDEPILSLLVTEEPTFGPS